jgi:hypothetical protein
MKAVSIHDLARIVNYLYEINDPRRTAYGEYPAQTDRYYRHSLYGVSAGNEIKAAPKLLDSLEVKGGVVTADAMSCQTEIVKKIQEKEADYVLAVKEKQKTLYGDIKEYFEGMESGEIGEMPEDIWRGGREGARAY